MVIGYTPSKQQPIGLKSQWVILFVKKRPVFYLHKIKVFINWHDSSSNKNNEENYNNYMGTMGF